MLRVAITGYPGTGKTLVTSLFKLKGDVLTINTDFIAREVLLKNHRKIRRLLKIPFYVHKNSLS